MKSTVALCAALVALATSMAIAGEATCYEEPGTLRHSCYDSGAVRANGSIRAAPFLTGGPQGVRLTGFTLVVDCQKGITAIRDRDGVNFGGAESSATAATRRLSTWMCDEKKTKKDPKLRLF